MRKPSLATIGLMQAVGGIAYCLLVAGLLSFMENIANRPPQIIAITFMLFLLVFSAAVSGSIVFAYPAYLITARKETKNAIMVLGYTLLFSALLIVALLLVLSSQF